MEDEKKEYSKIMKIAEENKKELIAQIEIEVGIIKSFIDLNREIIKENTIQANKQDVNYVPDESALKELNKWLHTLENAREKLSNLVLNPETIISEQGVFLTKSQELLDYINKNKVPLQSNFTKSNLSILIAAISKKDELKVKLNDLQNKLTYLNYKKAEYEEEKLKKQRIVDRIKLKFLRRKKIKKCNSEIEQYNVNIGDIVAETQIIENEIKETKKRIEKCRYNGEKLNSLSQTKEIKNELVDDLDDLQNEDREPGN